MIEHEWASADLYSLGLSPLRGGVQREKNNERGGGEALKVHELVECENM